MKKLIPLATITLLLALLLAGCRYGNFAALGGTTFDVDDRAEFDIDGIHNIVISTVSDDAIVLAGEGKAVAELKGGCTSTTKPVWLDARKEGDTLRIEVKYPLTIHNSSTKLTVVIPSAYEGGLSVKTVSGGISASGLPFRLQKVTLGSVSGGIRFGTASYDSLKANTTSGEIDIAGIAARTEAGTVSGGVRLEYAVFAETSVSTVSGSVEALIPESAAFRLDFGTVSGSFRTNHAGLNVDSARGGFEATVGGGSELLRVKTTSGDFRLEGK